MLTGWMHKIINFKNDVLNLHSKEELLYFKFDLFTLKTLFNIVEERLKKLLNFDVSAV